MVTSDQTTKFISILGENYIFMEITVKASDKYTLEFFNLQMLIGDGLDNSIFNNLNL